MANPTVRVCIITDQIYFDMAKLCVNEIVLHKNPETKLHLYIIGNNVDTSIFQKYRELENIEVTTCSEDFDKKWKFYNNYRYLTSTVYVRLLIPTFSFFKDVGRVLYLDTDILAQKDLSGFYNENIYGSAMGVVKDFGLANVFNHGPVDLKTYGYFNTGQLLMNIQILRKMDFTKKCLALMHKSGMTDDQPIINTVLKGKVKFLDPIYFFPWHKTVTTKGKYLDINLWNKTYGTHYKSIDELCEKSVLWHFHGNKQRQRENPVFREMFDSALQRANEFLDKK